MSTKISKVSIVEDQAPIMDFLGRIFDRAEDFECLGKYRVKASFDVGCNVITRNNNRDKWGEVNVHGFVLSKLNYG